MADRDLKNVSAMRQGVVCLPLTYTFTNSSGEVAPAPNTIEGVTVGPLAVSSGLQFITLDERWEDFISVDIAIADSSYVANAVPFVIMDSFHVGAGDHPDAGSDGKPFGNYVGRIWVKIVHGDVNPVQTMVRSDVYNVQANPQGTTMHVNLWLTMAGKRTDL